MHPEARILNTSSESLRIQSLKFKVLFKYEKGL